MVRTTLMGLAIVALIALAPVPHGTPVAGGASNCAGLRGCNDLKALDVVVVDVVEGLLGPESRADTLARSIRSRSPGSPEWDRLVEVRTNGIRGVVGFLRLLTRERSAWLERTNLPPAIRTEGRDRVEAAIRQVEILRRRWREARQIERQGVYAGRTAVQRARAI